LAVKAKRYYPSGITGGPEIFEAMEKRAKEVRKELKKDKQMAESALAQITPEGQNQPPPEGLAEFQSRLTELKNRRDELLRACGAGRQSETRRHALIPKISQIEEKLEAVRAKVQNLTLELERIELQLS